jgi:hypothetical protein
MRRALGIAVLLLSLPALSLAEAPDDLRRQPYLFGAPGVILYEGGITTLELGGGMQWLVFHPRLGLGLGFDASILTPADCFACGGVFFGSFDASYQFVPSSGRLVPFVVGGLGIGAAFAEDGVALGNLGGGVNYWFENGMALRFEVRDRFDRSGGHLLGFRVGVTF